MTTIPFEQVRQMIKSRSRAERIQLIEDIAETLKQEIAAEQPISQPKKPRILGLHAHLGEGWMSDDFGSELPDSFWLGQE